METLKRCLSSGALAVLVASVPFRPDTDQAGPPELVAAILARRTGGKLLVVATGVELE